MQTQDPDVSPQATALTNAAHNGIKSPNSRHVSISHLRKQQAESDGFNGLLGTSVKPPSTKSRRSKSSAALRPTASQPLLPSTVPDSHSARMAMAESQSQGDTQPLSQGVQEEFTSRLRDQHGLSVSDVTGVQDLSRSYQPGETGHVDLLAGFEQPSTNDFDEQNAPDDDVDPLSQAVDVRAELYPESKRFQEPKTPATVGTKRSRDGSAISRENTTPRLPVNPFAGQVTRFEGMMNASQAFKATQFTSPPPNQTVSEPFSDRPSPDMFDPPRPSTADPTSSPAKLPRSNMVRAVTEPQTTYISMKESQAERERQLQRSARPMQDDLDEDFESDGSELRRRKRQRRLETEAKTLFQGVTARPRPGPSARGRGGRRSRTLRSSPHRRSGRGPAEAVVISDDPLAEGNITEDETEHEQDHSASDTDSTDELAEDNKENIGIKHLQIPMTTSRINGRRAIRITSQPSPSRLRARKSVSPVSSMRSASESRVVNGTASTQVIESPPGMTQTVAIVDSQPSGDPRPLNSRGITSKENTAIGSSPESRLVIPQSQPDANAKADQLELRKGIALTPESPNARARSPRRSRAIGSSPTSVSQIDRSTSTQGRRGNLVPPTTASGGFTSSIDQVSGSPHRSTENRLPSMEREYVARAHRLAEVHDAMSKAADQQSAYETAAFSAPEKAREEFDFRSSKNTDDHGKAGEPQTQIRVSSTLPESSLASSRIEPRTAFPVSSEPSTYTNLRGSNVANLNSNASTAFATAATHLTTSPSKLRINRPETPNPSSSPRITRARTLTEIAANPSPPNPVSSADIDVNLLTKDDLEFQTILNGSSPVRPARKRRRVNDGQALKLDSSPNNVVMHFGKAVGESSTAENIISSSSALNVHEPPQRQPEHNAAAGGRISCPPGPSVEQSTEVQVDDSHIPVSRARTPPAQKALPPSAVLTASRKRGRPRKVTKDLTEADHAGTKGLENDPAKTDKSLRIEVPKVRTGQSDDLISGASELVIAPNRVFAHFNGKNCAAYFPATCIGTIGGEEPQYRVRFDDGTIDTINGYAIRRLELRSGDYVKLDQGGARKNVYIVERVQDRQRPLLTPDPETPTRHGLSASKAALSASQTDIRGYASVVVRLKQAHPSDKVANDESLTVPVKDVYLTQTLWTSFKDRGYTYIPIRSQSGSKLETPSDHPSSTSTPSSRARRLKGSSVTHQRSALAPAPVNVGIFNNMVFGITNISDPSLRNTLQKQICTYGGHLLNDGFDELFHIPESGYASPSKRSPKRDSATIFELTPAGKQTGFTCLFADKHCRMAKYVQALALGIPCLAVRWVQDCIAKQQLLPWQPYLLAAGESSYLGGAVRSRQLSAFPPATATLKEIIDNRSKLLDGDSVLLIVEKGEQEKMKSHPLITHGLGARKVFSAAGLDAAARAIDEASMNGEPWDWVYSHDKEDKVERALFGRGGLSSRKRKRGVESKMTDSERKTRVVDNEFVIQSLILGQLVS